MELFHENKNRYFSLVSKILNLASNGLDENDLKTLIADGEYEEKLIGKDFESFEGLLLNKYTKENNLNLLKLENKKYYPVIGKNGFNPVPVRFTNIEKQWLKELLKDSNFRNLLGDKICVVLDTELEELKDMNMTSIIEKTNVIKRNNNHLNESYYNSFLKILTAIKEDKEIVYDNKDKFGNEYKGLRGLPLKIEHCMKDEIIRISLYFIEENRPVMVNLHTLSNIEIKEDKECNLTKLEIFKSLKDKKYCSEPIVFELKDEKEAMERCFMSFSSFERTARVIGENLYEIKIYYYTFDEDEVIRRILSLGHFVKVIEPSRIRKKIIDRLVLALEL